MEFLLAFLIQTGHGGNGGHDGHLGHGGGVSTLPVDSVFANHADLNLWVVRWAERVAPSRRDTLLSLLPRVAFEKMAVLTGVTDLEGGGGAGEAASGGKGGGSSSDPWVSWEKAPDGPYVVQYTFTATAVL